MEGPIQAFGGCTFPVYLLLASILLKKIKKNKKINYTSVPSFSFIFQTVCWQNTWQISKIYSVPSYAIAPPNFRLFLKHGKCKSCAGRRLFFKGSVIVSLHRKINKIQTLNLQTIYMYSLCDWKKPERRGYNKKTRKFIYLFYLSSYIRNDNMLNLFMIKIIIIIKLLK